MERNPNYMHVTGSDLVYIRVLSLSVTEQGLKGSL